MGESQSSQDEEARDYGRLTLGIAAHLETLDGRKIVRLVDLSQGGAQVILAEDIEIRECVLRALEFEVFCIAAWRDGERLGLEFEKPLSIRTIVAVRDIAPSLIREDSLSAERVARAWVEGK